VRAAELEPKNAEVWERLAAIHLNKSEHHLGLASARKAEKLGAKSVFVKLLLGRAMAATQPLHEALSPLEHEKDLSRKILKNEKVLDAVAQVISTSVQQFGPLHLARGIRKLQSLAPEAAEEGAIGRILTAVLTRRLPQIAGSAHDWEKSLSELHAILEDDEASVIPLQMLTAAVLYAMTGNREHLVSLPLEQRNLLEIDQFDGSESTTESSHDH
jgi:hypothetical protein